MKDMPTKKYGEQDYLRESQILSILQFSEKIGNPCTNQESLLLETKNC